MAPQQRTEPGDRHVQWPENGFHRGYHEVPPQHKGHDRELQHKAKKKKVSMQVWT